MRTPIVVVALAALSTALLGCPKPLPAQEEWRAVEGAPATRSILTEEQQKQSDDVKLRARINKMRAALVSTKERACESDEECTLTSFHCCNCASGGQMTAVNKEKVPELMKRRGAICEDYACSQVISDHPSCAAERAVCQDGQCVPDVPEGAGAPAGIGVEKIPDEQGEE